MDFGTLLHVAKKNSETKNNERKFYSTKFSAPKKESKTEKKLSDNIKKFLEKKEHEEKEKARIEKKKVDELLAMRDEKSKNKIKKMLKVTKSANRSVLDDVDNNNTAVTMEGPDQPDEDDYGYVSNTAAEFYKKYVDKVGKIPEEQKFSASRPLSKTDLVGTKDRVKAAILREQEEKAAGRSKSTSSSKSSSTSTSSTPSSSTDDTRSSKSRKDLYDPEAEREAELQQKREEQKKAKLKNQRAAPPPLDFKELLKLAEKKQFEPLEVKVEEKKDNGRLLTKKEKLEMEERKAYFEEKEKRRKAQAMGMNKMQSNGGKIPKLNSSAPSPISSLKSNKSNQQMPVSSKDGNFKKPIDVPQRILTPKPTATVQSNVSRENKDMSSKHLKDNKPPIPKPSSTAVGRSGSGSAGGFSGGNKNVTKTTSNLPKPSNGGPTRELPQKDIKKVPSKEQNYKDIKPREFPPKAVQSTRQFPPPDVRRSKPEDRKPNKRRIYDDDDDEYDSELDDFIDDGPEDDNAGYSKYIKQIFGYDKSRYRDIDDDDSGMESSFAQQMHEETISKKIGLMEDLEDMKQEAQDKKRKAERMKKMKYK